MEDSDTETEESSDEDKESPAGGAEPCPVINVEETARRIKEQFRANMARVMVQHLNPYRHSDAPAGRITSTADFKHLARKVLVEYIHIYR